MRTDLDTARRAARQSNIDRYRRILRTQLTEQERRFVERRLAEEEGTLRERAVPRQTANPAVTRTMSPPARKIIELNIAHFRRLLETEQNPAKRETIMRLLKEQEEAMIRLSKGEAG